MIETLKEVREALNLATTPLARDRQEVLRALTKLDALIAAQEKAEVVARWNTRHHPAASIPTWTAVIDKAPTPEGCKHGVGCLVLRPITNGTHVNLIVDYAWYYAGQWTRQSGRTYKEDGYWDEITHWMPLPAAPKIGAVNAAQEKAEPVAWTLTEELIKRETTTCGRRSTPH